MPALQLKDWMPKKWLRLPETKRVDEVISRDLSTYYPVLALLLLLTVIAAALPFIITRLIV